MSTNEENIDIDYLISLVQEREILWDKSHVDFKINNNLKSKAWEQISRKLFPDYDSFDTDEKNKIGNHIVKKWRNVKDNFHKYLKKLKETSKSGSAAKALKKYHYYHQLLFLTKVAQNATDSSLDSTSNTNTSAPNDTLPETPNDTVHESSRYVPTTRKRTMPMDDFEKGTLQALKELENRHMSFFKGIVPSIQDFTERQTLSFQSRVLQTITEMRYGETNLPSSSHGYRQALQQPHSYGYHTKDHHSQNSNLNTSPCQASEDQEEFDFSDF